jgi:hypothetical protein
MCHPFCTKRGSIAHGIITFEPVQQRTGRGTEKVVGGREAHSTQSSSYDERQWRVEGGGWRVEGGGWGGGRGGGGRGGAGGGGGGGGGEGYAGEVGVVRLGEGYVSGDP